MTTSQILDKIVNFIQDMTAFHAELSRELPNLRVVVDNTREFSELKKMPQRSSHSLAIRRYLRKVYIKMTVMLTPHRLKMTKQAF